VSKQHGYYSIVLRIYINKNAVGIGQITLVNMATCALENKYGNWPICLGHMRLECNPVSVSAKHKVAGHTFCQKFPQTQTNESQTKRRNKNSRDKEKRFSKKGEREETTIETIINYTHSRTWRQDTETEAEKKNKTHTEKQ